MATRTAPASLSRQKRIRKIFGNIHEVIDMPNLIEVQREATRILQLDHDVGDWPMSVAPTPARIMGLEQHGRISAGCAADLILLRARNWSELFARPQADRTVLVDGRMIDTALPDHRELDVLFKS